MNCWLTAIIFFLLTALYIYITTWINEIYFCVLLYRTSLLYFGRKPSYVAQINQFKLQSNANATCQRVIEYSFEKVFFTHWNLAYAFSRTMTLLALTNTMEGSPSCVAKSGYRIPRLLCNINVHHPLKNSHPHFPIQNHMNSSQMIQSYFLNLY